MSIADKLTVVAENERKVYDAGYANGEDVGYNNGKIVGFDEGVAEGKEIGYNEGHNAYGDLIWEALQDGGKRTDYKRVFYNWDKFTECFKPKYDIKPVGSVAEMFANINQYISIPNVCSSRGIVIDFSKATEFRNILQGSAIWHFGVVDCSSATTLDHAFNLASSLQKIDKLIVHEGITSYSACFANTSLLKNITVEGTIAGTGIFLSAHKGLSHDSLMSFIYALKDYSGTSTTKTITFGSVNLAKLTDSEKAIATERGWTLA